MDTWFVRCNGDTAHNEAATFGYISGEPPNFPVRSFNYRRECLKGGFARLGMPAAGDLQDQNWRDRARKAYPDIASRHFRYLEQFRNIRPGDLALIPTYEAKYEVHLGRVVPPRKTASGSARGGAYYYYFDIQAGDWYENAHRIDVTWACDKSGRASTYHISEIGGVWPRAFGPVFTNNQRIVQLASDAGLLR